ncbi:MAG: acyl-CoA thioesterase [Pseudomonadota bacterium]
MNLYFRLLLRLLASYRAPRISTADETRQWFRVWPHDIDVFGHMNNGRYLQMMDVARTVWMRRCGALGVMRRQRWGAALGGGSIRFRRALKPFARYELTTRLLGWDSRWFYLEHGFNDAQGRCVAVGLSRAAICSRQGWVRTSEVMDLVDPGVTAPELPAYVSALGQQEEAMQRCYSAHQQRTLAPAPTPHFALHEQDQEEQAA